MIQQIQGVVAAPSHPSVCSRLNFGQSSSGHKKQPPQPLKVLLAHVKGKAQVKQIYVPKKKEEMPAVPTQEVGPPTSITIGFAKVPIIKINELIQR
jgi:hypothetical protein